MQLRTLGDLPAGVSPAGGSGNWWDFLPSLLTGAAAVYTQQQLLDYNRNAAAQGLPILSPSQMQAMMAGAQPGVNIGMSADVKSMATYALFGAGALALFYILMRRMR